MPLRAVLALAALVIALSLSACGDDDDGGDAGAPSADSSQASDGANKNASNGGVSNGGSGNASSGDTEPINLKQERLTPAELQRLQQEAPQPRPYTRFGFDRGSQKDRNTLMNMFRAMQREFFGGEFLAFCKRFGTGLYALPGLESGDGEQRVKECAGIVSRVAKRLASGDLDWQPHEVEWVRIYRDPGRDPYGGVTVSTSGPDIRVSYSELGGRWRPDFRVPRDLEAFNAK